MTQKKAQPTHSAIQQMLANHSLASDMQEEKAAEGVEPKAEDPAEGEPSDTTESSDIADTELAQKLKELLSTDSNSETLSLVTAMKEAQAAVEEVQEMQEEQAAEQEVDQAIKSGKYKPASRAALVGIAKQNLAAFKSITKSVPSVHANRVAHIKPSTDKLTAEEEKTIQQAGVSREAYLSARAAIAAKK